MQELRNEYTGEGAGTTDGGTPTDTAHRSWETGERRAEEAASETAGGARRFRDEVAEKLRTAKESAGVTYDRTADQAVRMYRGAREYAVANPGTAAAITFAAGVGVGMLVASRNGSRVYRQGLVPVVAVALAQAVIDVFGAR
jgi:ElaB/YqjD/DUF883 family membrane-anchored ribosome-binding protein